MREKRENPTFSADAFFAQFERNVGGDNGDETRLRRSPLVFIPPGIACVMSWFATANTQAMNMRLDR